MAVGTLIASIVAAVAAVLGIALAIWWRRTKLVVTFPPTFHVSESHVTFLVSLENLGATMIPQIEVWAGISPGDLIDPRNRRDRFALRAGESRSIEFGVARPERVEMEAGQVRPTLKVPVSAAVWYGRRLVLVPHPWGPQPRERFRRTRALWRSLHRRRERRSTSWYGRVETAHRADDLGRDGRGSDER